MWWRKTRTEAERKVLRCAFCDKLQHKVQELIAGPRVFICNECVEVCNDILADARRFTGGGPRPEDPLAWPNAIPCTLCHVRLQPDDGIIIADNRGTLCIDCVKAVAMARSPLLDSSHGQR
jgi:hypothetical protein